MRVYENGLVKTLLGLLTFIDCHRRTQKYSLMEIPKFQNAEQ